MGEPKAKAVALSRSYPLSVTFFLCASLIAASPHALSQQPAAASPQKSGHTVQAASTDKEFEFSDKPDFTVAGVTDWTAVGGHGSDVTLRTSESLARETLTLKAPATVCGSCGDRTSNKAPDATETRLRASLAAAPGNYAANRDLGEYYLHAAKYAQAIPLLEAASKTPQQDARDQYNLALACRGVGDFAQARQHLQRAQLKQDSAELHRLAGELDESTGDLACRGERA